MHRREQSVEPSEHAPETSDGSETWHDGDKLFDLIPDALVIVDHTGMIRQANRQSIAMFGYEETELLGRPVEMLMPERVRQPHRSQREAYQRHPAIRHMGAGLELRGRRKDGGEFPVDIMISPLPASGGLVLAVVRDATAAKAMTAELRRLAYADPLTGLPNRAALYRDLRACLDCDPALAEPMAVALFDLDGFKEVNDTLGHSAGDQLLKIGSERCQAVMGGGVQLYRLGGDEFVAAIAGCGNPQRAADVATRLMQALEQPFDIDGQQAYISSSVGIAFASGEGCDAETLLVNVDLALYKAKAAGRNTYAFFQDSFRADAQAHRSMDLRLRRAHAEGEFELFFQPTVRLSDQGLCGAEALLRWREGGRIVPPGEFIDKLSASPLVGATGDWILRTACEAAAVWRTGAHPDFRMGVNLFPGQFNDPGLAEKVENVLATSRLAPAALQLEITETIALNSSAASLAPLNRLRELGVGLAFDDFGTGYASLSFLTQMPLTHIKIDQSFVRGLPEDEKLGAVVRSLIAMAHGIGLCVIAEGVETPAQAEFLRLHGCDEAQGYLFAKPLPAPAFEAFLKRSAEEGRS